jgi:hypothetical protein
MGRLSRLAPSLALRWPLALHETVRQPAIQFFFRRAFAFRFSANCPTTFLSSMVNTYRSRHEQSPVHPMNRFLFT